MRFLVDECLPLRLAKALRANGHDATHISERGLNGAPDAEVMVAAADDNRILLLPLEV